MTKPQGIALILLSVFAIACSPPAVNLTPAKSPEVVGVQVPEARPSETRELGPIIATSDVQETSTITVDSPAQADAESTVFLPFIQTVSATPNPGTAIIANNLILGQFESIPETYVHAAAANDLLFLHQSTGNNIEYYGLDCLAGMRNDPENYPQCVSYDQNPGYYDISKWDWEEWPDSNPEPVVFTKMDQYVSIVNARQSNYDILGMKYCYVDFWNQELDVFSQYRQKMEQVESAYPNKIFIWSTSALWATPGNACDPNGWNSCLAISDFNRQVREYARAHNRPLYDVASIESDGGTCTVGGYEGMCLKYNSDGGGHPNEEGALRLAKGFWWLIARLSGWTP